LVGLRPIPFVGFGLCRYVHRRPIRVLRLLKRRGKEEDEEEGEEAFGLVLRK